MAVITTPNLGLNLPSKGEQNWDTLINQNMSKIDNEINTNINSINEVNTQLADIVQYNSHHVTNIGVVDKIIPSTREYTINNTNLLNYLNDKPNVELYFPDGKYYLTSSITFTTGVSLKLHKNAEIIAQNTMDYMFNFSNSVIPGTLDSYMRHQFITGGTFNGNDKANDILRLNKFQDFLITDTVIKNTLKRGIITNTEGNYSHELKLDNIYFCNDNYLTGIIDNVTDNVAIQLDSPDNYIHNCTIVDFSKGIVINKPGNYVDKVHFWTSQGDRIPNTIAFDCADSTWAKFSYCVSDTAQIGFRVAEDAWIDHCQVLNNSFYDAYFLTAPTAVYLVDGYVKVQINDCAFEGKNALGLNILNFTSTTAMKGTFQGNTLWNTCNNVPTEIFLNVSKSWTPSVVGATVEGTPTYTTRTGMYTKVGKMCTLAVAVKCTLDDLISGALKITGLPYAAAVHSPVVIGYRKGFAATEINLYGEIFTGTSEIVINKLNTTTGISESIYGSNYRSVEIEFHISATYLIQ